MPGWLKGAVNWIVGGVKDVWNKAVGLIMSVVTWAQTLFSQLWSDLDDFYNALSTYISAVETWAGSLYDAVRATLISDITNTINWASREITALGRDISAVETWTSGLISGLRGLISSLINGAINWVIKNVYDPLAHDITSALNWIAKSGAYAYYLLTHPDALAQLLAKYLWESWLSLFKKYAPHIGKWLLHSMVTLASPAGTIIEDIISSIVD